jgi:hypothetical protein
MIPLSPIVQFSKLTAEHVKSTKPCTATLIAGLCYLGQTTILDKRPGDSRLQLNVGVVLPQFAPLYEEREKKRLDLPSSSAHLYRKAEYNSLDTLLIPIPVKRARGRLAGSTNPYEIFPVGSASCPCYVINFIIYLK